jgi:hypothetical protein
MKNTFKLVFAFLLVTLAFSACLKNEIKQKITMAIPVFETKSDYYAKLKLQQPQEIENPSKFILYKNYVLLQDLLRGIHIINISNISNPVKIGFIPAGNAQDMAIKDDMLYLDCQRDLVTLNITDINSITLSHIIENAFNEFSGPISSNASTVFAGYKFVDTTIKENYVLYSKNYYGTQSGTTTLNTFSPANLGGGSNGGTSTGGSMARFCVINNFLYTVDNSSVFVFGITNPAIPVKGNNLQLNASLETIYPMSDKLFLGSTTGMFILSISNPELPVMLGTFSHARVCDPVIADGNIAYVTLRSGTQCLGFTNQLDVVDIANVSNPKLIKSYAMSNPHGLSKKGNTLYICDDDKLKVLDVENTNDVKEIKSITMAKTFDVIVAGNTAFVSAADGLHLFDITVATAPIERSLIK